VFQPLFSELGVPPLELFDLDENFSSERSQLTQLTNKCMEDERKEADDKELAYYVLECAKIIEPSRDDQKVTAKEVLHQMGMKIANYKKL
jgi:intraflagellar transport protein 52